MSLQAKYTEQERAVALAFYDACGKNVSEAARRADVPRKTLESWVNGGATNPAVAKTRQDIKKDLADKLEHLAHVIADAMPDKVERAGLQASAVSLGVAIDKMRLLREQATTITEDVSKLPDDQLDAQRDDLRRRIAAIEGAGVAVGPGEVEAAPEPAP